MAEQLISIGYGKESFATTSASLSAFVVTGDFERTLPSKKFKRQGNCQRFPASLHPEINGYLYLDSITQVPDGTIILLQSSHRFRATPIRDGAVILRMRATGPMLTVTATLPSAIESVIAGGFLAFQGRADILDLDELALYDVHPPKNYVNGFLNAEEVAECYTVATMAPESASRPSFEQIEDRYGNVVLTPTRPGRKLSLRRA